MNLVRFQKTPSSEISKRELRRRNDKILKCSAIINGEECKRAGLLAAAAHNTSVSNLATLIKGNSISHKAAKSLKNDLPQSSYEESKMKSISTLYDGGIMSKRKYQKIVERERAEMKTLNSRAVPTHCIPKHLPYAKVMSAVKAVDRPCLLPCFDDDTPCYKYRLRDIVPHILPVYLDMGESNPSSLKWFGMPQTFQLAIGEDGAPLSQVRSMHTMLLSVLNFSESVSSPKHNHIIMAGECAENDVRLETYYKTLTEEIRDMSENGIVIGDKHFDIKVSLFPADQKFHAHLAGELSNAATYPSTYADLKKTDLSMDKHGILPGQFGRWKPWDFEHRLKVAAKVSEFKRQMPVRAKVTEFIAKQKSRQEFTPLVGDYVNSFLVEPLHVKNNAMCEYFQLLLGEGVNLSSAADLKHPWEIGTCIGKFLNEVKASIGRIGVKLKGIINQQSLVKGKRLELRFTGEDSYKLARSFPNLASILVQHTTDSSVLLRLHAIHELGIHLVNACAWMSAVTITEDTICKLEEASAIYFNIHKFYLDSVPLCVWTLGYVAPMHARIAFARFGCGLGCTQPTVGRQNSSMLRVL